ncbi:MAG TPA: hypothetical protein VIR59_13240 [Gaiellaceae bacterium]
MRGLVAVAAVIAALAIVGTSAAALVPGVYDPGNTGCVHATFSNGVLHLEKNCPTSTNAAAGADITGLEGQPFTSASFTLASTSQCQGGSPRFDVQTTTGFFFLGCNNVIPVGNTYTFDAATIAAAGNQVPVPTGDIVSISVLIDVEGTADLTDITVNGQVQVPATPMTANDCKNGGWQTFVSPAFKNQGDCVSWVATNGRNAPNG